MSDALARLLSVVPEMRDAVARIPGRPEWLKRLTGSPSSSWDPISTSDLTNKALAAGLQLEVEQLRDRIGALEEERDELGRKYEASRAGEAAWTCRFIAGDQLIFGNAAGERAMFPLALAVQYRSHLPTTLTNVFERDGDTLFLQGKTVVASIPRSLWAVLDRVLEACSWLPRTLPSPGSESPSPGIPTDSGSAA